MTGVPYLCGRHEGTDSVGHADEQAALDRSRPEVHLADEFRTIRAIQYVGDGAREDARRIANSERDSIPLLDIRQRQRFERNATTPPIMLRRERADLRVQIERSAKAADQEPIEKKIQELARRFRRP